MTTPDWHGWGAGDVTLSVAPNPYAPDTAALILTVQGEHDIVAEFTSEQGALDVMAFIDNALRATAESNATLRQEVERLGGS